jgi:CoA-transferase family III
MHDAVSHALLSEIVSAFELPSESVRRVRFIGSERLPSCFPVSDLAVAAMGSACLAISELVGQVSAAPDLAVDYRLASLWFGISLRPRGWKLPAAWDAIAGDYRSQDGWIKIHTNAPAHKSAALSVLSCNASREAVARAVAGWQGDALEQAIVDASGCAATLRDRSEWQVHPQGQAVAQEPLIRRTATANAVVSGWRPLPGRPLTGLRVLDLTRVLAGPVATRFLAGYGAQVLRIDPPAWDEPGVIPEVTPGKRCARLDLHAANDRRTFEYLLSQADILVHGYRADALERLGYGPNERQKIRPGLIDVSLNAYGHMGPWATRRGFDSLVQFSCGIAAQGMAWRKLETPVSLPVQALDHATGYLMAAAALRGLIARTRGEPSAQYQLSLARTAELLFKHKSDPVETPMVDVTSDDVSEEVEETAWGPASRIRAPAAIADVPLRWATPAVPLGSAQAAWCD